MSTKQQPDALLLASSLRAESDSTSRGVKYSTAKRAANELVRQHTRIAELEASQAQRTPLSDEQIESLLRSWPEDSIAFFDFARAIEAAHGITQEKHQ